MIKREAKFTTLFRHWVRANKRNLFSSAFELKQTTGKSIPFSDVQEHQLDALLAAKHDGLLYKAPDDSRGIKPFDMFFLYNARAFVVIRYPDFFCLIDVEVFIEERQISERKSLTAQRAREIAHEVIEL